MNSYFARQPRATLAHCKECVGSVLISHPVAETHLAYSVDFRGRIVRMRQAGGLRLTEPVAPRNAGFGSHVHQPPYGSWLPAGAYKEKPGRMLRDCALGRRLCAA